MEEILAAAVTTVDIVVVYLLLRIKKGRFTLVVWTSFLNMLLPFLGFLMGELSLSVFTGWSIVLSSLLLVLIGLHMLLQDDNEQTPKNLNPAIIALAVSVDSFSVSVSFGMLHMNKILFILASGIFSFSFAFLALYYKGRLGIKNGNLLRRVGGLALLIMGIMSWFR